MNLLMKIIIAVLSCWIGDAFCKNNLLRHCSNNFTQSNEWFKLGQFSAYCMQYNSAVYGVHSTFDAKCKSWQCRQCMKACSKPVPFDLHQCICDCGGCPSCRNGCSFYSQLFQGKSHGDPQDFQLNNRPVVVLPSVNVDKRRTSKVSTSWSEITSRGSISLSSVYLLILEVKTRLFVKNTVIGLTTDNDYDVTLPNICSVFGFYKYIDPTEAKLTVHPINFNGWKDNEKLISSYFTFKKISPVQNIMIKTPPTFVPKPFALSLDSVKWNITWDSPDDADTVDSVRIRSSVRSCKDINNFGEILRLGDTSEKQVPSDSPSEITIPNTDGDHLRGCTIEVKVTTLQDGCLVGQEATQTVLYEGCETVIGGQCPTPTTPKPTDGPITGRSLTILGNDCLSCDNNKCVNGTYTVQVRWTTPVTASPIQRYELRWGKAEILSLPMPIPIIITWVDPKGVLTRTEDISPNETSFTITDVPYDIVKLGVLLHAHTATSDPLRPLLQSKYDFLDIPELLC